ncbi:MAG: C4-dicarboxylate ABC transporter permease [Spirochaetae bacterium HGW-Spirochaetae-4]|jgi:C4-dicarboxylate transporter DctM subunit|nr:MAG: C4-dicarboxylate ABC transporter permease [Spirochaetes bacterium GWC2_52_13]PKL12754.1 MAG: C4-dicarboxylate ABC transporter permease [Spirochaetae bacterium HGW-Spirochaetae-8]PKL19786.1 MAG: C4-dicarboxylate ABC transporter permease [Spirochaetae bacterium HGW-Spirochaetae-4]HCG62533.1 C4-dicarboxylate ABC transporter permease [Sphaerochaeta sp.]HCS36901.1 C4-dicarboxylate ABC transporter permease [Sphaerochaeta sp.]
MIATLFLSFAFLLVIEMPVSFSLLISSVLSMALFSDIDLISIIVKMFRASSNFSQIAIPFFILAGGLMDNGGISRRLVKLASNMIGHLRGGLAHSSVIAAMFFAGLSGAAAADTAAVGSLLIPAMKEKGYGKDISTAVMATAGSIGIVIPPSIPMIILGVTAGISIGGLFMGGVIPGIMMGLSLMVVNYIYTKIRKLDPEPRASFKEIMHSLVDSFLALFTVVIIVGGIVAGIFTPTEASIIAAVYAFIIGFFVYKELKFKDLGPILVKTAITTGVVVLTIAAASSFGWILAAEQIPTQIANFLVSLTESRIVLLLLINLLFLVLGTFLDPSAIIIIVVPIIWPVVSALGVHPLHFGLMTIVNMAIGQCTPPVGIALFVASGISGAKLSEVLRVHMSYLGALVLVLLLVIFIPELSLTIPRLTGYI